MGGEPYKDLKLYINNGCCSHRTGGVCTALLVLSQVDFTLLLFNVTNNGC